jgi:hypothetical protein
MARSLSAESDRPKSVPSSLRRYAEAPRRRELSVGVAPTDKPLVFEVEAAITSTQMPLRYSPASFARLASSRSNGELKYSIVSPKPRRSVETG